MVAEAADYPPASEIRSAIRTTTTPSRQFVSWKRLDNDNNNWQQQQSYHTKTTNWKRQSRRQHQQQQQLQETVEDLFQNSLHQKVQLAALKSTTTRATLRNKNDPRSKQKAGPSSTTSELSSAASSSSSSSKNNNMDATTGRVNMWPPWPLNLLLSASRRRHRRRQVDEEGDDDDDEKGGEIRAKHVYPSTGALFWAYLSQQTRIGFRQMQELGSQLWFHTPPFFPPLLLIASLPRTVLVVAATSEQVATTTRTIPLFTNPLIRNLCLWGIFISLMSWSHSELHRKRLLVPLPLSETYRDINRAVLPPFLPDQVPELDFMVLETTTTMTSSSSSPSSSSSFFATVNHNHKDRNDQDNQTIIATVTGISAVRELTHQSAGASMTLPTTATTTTTTTDDMASSTPSNVVVEDDEDMEASKSMKFLISSVPPRLRRHLRQTLNQMIITNPTSFSLRSTLREWKVSRQVRQLERERLKRMSIYDELVALQKFKHQAKLSAAAKNQKKAEQNKQQRHARGGRADHHHAQNNNTEAESSSPLTAPLGYALVTGSSRGIGRAIAVELARWDIPLILVARDRDRLMQLAHDLQACYGVKCCVLPADLSQPNAAQRIWETTRNAGLRVDVLINNAGFSIHGLYVDTPLKDTNRMLQVNAVSVAELNQLYGRDMKEQGRGRILVVSSVNGEVAAVPTVALYSATKAFEKSLALGMAKEMEPYGVGVTCLIPGAVRGTDFKTQSKTDEALCWKIPFYPLSPARVAHQAVRGLLDGDVEITPGWLNRAFLKMAKPMLPQRIHNMVAEWFWNPLSISWPSFRRRSQGGTASVNIQARDDTKRSFLPDEDERHQHQTRHFPSSLNFVSPPRLLEIEDDETTAEADVEDGLVSQDEDTPGSSSEDSSSSPTSETELTTIPNTDDVSSSSSNESDRLRLNTMD